MPERTYLRIRRRRNAISALKIQLDGIKYDPFSDSSSSLDLDHLTITEQLASSDPPDIAASNPTAQGSSIPHPRPSKRSRSVIWRRVSSKEHPDKLLAPNKKREYKVVDAILDDDEKDEAMRNEQQRHAGAKKRRRLTLVETLSPDTTGGTLSESSRAVSKRKKPAYKVLPPCERLVDDSLQQVFVGTKSVSDHFALCSLDPRLAHQAQMWLSWSNSEHGNLLHACALWNDVAVAQDMLYRDLSTLLYGSDGDGRTPLIVAELCHHSDLTDLFRSVLVTSGADDEDYVFDLYCMDEGTSSEDADAEKEIDAPLDCELQGGVGYWDENGHLVLNPMQRTLSEVSVADDDDEQDDPNNEDWAGNDYPDECSSDDSLSDVGDDGRRISYRNHPVTLTNTGNGFHRAGDDGDFDAAYGIYGQREPEYDSEA